MHGVFDNALAAVVCRRPLPAAGPPPLVASFDQPAQVQSSEFVAPGRYMARLLYHAVVPLSSTLSIYSTK